MSKARDLADYISTGGVLEDGQIDSTEINGVTVSSTELNYLSGASSNIQNQLDNISVTSGTLTKTFAQDEVATITLSSSITTPVVSVTKEVPQTGTTNSSWDVNSTSENYTRLDSAPATTLDFVSTTVGTTYNSAFDISGQEGTIRGVAFKTDGTKMYIVGAANYTVYQYSLSTAWDISTASYDSVSFSLSSQMTSGANTPQFKSDGTIMYVLNFSDNTIYQYTLSTAWDVSTASYASKTLNMNTGTGAGNFYGYAFKSDGTKVYGLADAQSQIYVFNLTTAWDLSTGSYSSTGYGLGTDLVGVSEAGIVFNSAGTKYWVTDRTNDRIHQFSMSTAWDVTTSSYDSLYIDVDLAGASVNHPWSLQLSADEDKIYTTCFDVDDVLEYQLGRDMSLGSGSFASADVGKTIEANSGVFVLTSTAGAYSETTAPTSYAQVASGSWEMYGVVYNTTDGDLQLSGITTGLFDVSTASYSQSLSVSAQISDPQGISFNTDGTKLFVLDAFSDDVNEYTLSTAFDVSTATYSQNFSVTSEDTNPCGLAFNADGTKMFVVGNAGDDVNEYTLSTGFDVSTATYSQNFSVAAQEAGPRVVAFSTDGTKMFVAGSSGDDVNEYTLSTGFDVSTASITDTFSVSTQTTDPRGIGFNSDGTKMYVVGNGEVHEYSLPTAFDLSGASFTQSLSVSSEDGSPRGVAFNLDGSKMFVAGTTNDSVYEYTLGTTSIPTGYHAVHTTASTDTTYWTDINSMTADEAAGDGSIFYCVSTDDRSTWKIAHNTDGIRSIVRNNSGTWQYNSNGTYASTTWTNATTNTELNALQEAMTGAVTTTGYVLSGASYDSVDFSFTGQTSTPRGLVFSADGTKMYVAAEPNAYQYTLTTAYDLTTASYASKSFNFTTQSTSVLAIAFNSDGTKMYGISYSDKTVYQYALSTAYDISTASYDSKSFSVNAQETDPYNLTFNSDGTKMFVIGTSGDDVNEYSLSTADDVSTASFTTNFSVATQDSTPYAVAFSSDGTSMFISGNNTDAVWKYTLTTGFDLTTASYASETLYVGSQETTPNGIAFNADGTKMFVSGLGSDKVHQYSTGTSSYTNQMNKTQLDAVSDANHFTLANDLDLGIIFNLSSGTTVPSSDGVSINYDANVLNEGAILGTDYDFDAPAATKVRITALSANNLKVRVV